MKETKWNIGVCSWSLQRPISDVAAAMKKIGIDHVHLEVGPALTEKGQEYLSIVKQQDWTISSTMLDFPQEDYSTLETIKVTGGLVPDDTWPSNKDRFAMAAAITKELGVKYLSLHAGFIGHGDVEKYKIMCERIKSLGDIAAENQIMFLLETGQETAEELSSFLKDIGHSAIGINFDPANMILYDKGEPLEAMKILSPWVKHVHIKDAVKTKIPGQWGAEVPWGDGEVGSDLFLKMLDETGYEGTLAIEREAGDSRIDDIALAVKRLKEYMD